MNIDLDIYANTKYVRNRLAHTSASMSLNSALDNLYKHVTKLMYPTYLIGVNSVTA